MAMRKTMTRWPDQHIRGAFLPLAWAWGLYRLGDAPAAEGFRPRDGAHATVRLRPVSIREHVDKRAQGLNRSRRHGAGLHRQHAPCGSRFRNIHRISFVQVVVSVNTMTIYDVLIAGGGPVGLFLACELRLAGASVLLLEKNSTPGTPLKSGWIGARGLNFPSTEAIYRRGLLDEVKAASFGWMGGERPGMEFKGDGSTPPPPASAPRFAGHFAGIVLDASKVHFSGQKWIVPGPSVGGGMVSLEALENALAQRAKALGVEIHMGQEVTGLSETVDGVSVQAGGNDFQARWLVGCDGGRSSVRRLAGFEFEGAEPELTGYTATVEFEDLAGLAPGFNLTPRGLYTGRPPVASASSISIGASSIEPRKSLSKIFRRCCNMSPEQQ